MNIRYRIISISEMCEMEITASFGDSHSAFSQMDFSKDRFGILMGDDGLLPIGRVPMTEPRPQIYHLLRDGSGTLAVRPGETWLILSHSDMEDDVFMDYLDRYI